MIIDTLDEDAVWEYEEELKLLKREKESKESYDASDIYLVRTTGYFPNDSFLPTLCNIPFFVKHLPLVHDVVFDILKERAGNPTDLDTINELIEESHQYDVCNTQYRSSIHFCLNGLVGNHAYGTFDYPFIIVDPFEKHEQDENILAVRGEDTYFKDGIALSDEAVVLVPIELKDEIEETPLNVVYYKGDRELALRMYLVRNGIVPETVCSAYLSDSPTARMINEYIENCGFCRDKHSFSKNYNDDDDKSVVLWNHYAHQFFDYLFEEAYHDDAVRVEEREILSEDGSYFAGSRHYENYIALRSVIDDIGLDRFKEIVDSYNNMMEDKLKAGEIPTDNEFLGIEPVITRDSSDYGGK